MTKLLQDTTRGNMWKSGAWSYKHRGLGKGAEFSMTEKYFTKEKGKRSEQS